jgi:hypothetical protein
MANWLDRIAPKKLPVPTRVNLPARTNKGSGNNLLPTAPQNVFTEINKLPNASIVYAVAASALFVIALFFLFSGRWLNSFLVLLPAVCFLGFALHFMKHPQ